MNQAYEAAMRDPSGLLIGLSLNRLNTVTDGDVDLILEEAYAKSSLAEMGKLVNERLSSLPKTESSKYAPARESFLKILKDFDGNEKEYLKHALKSRRQDIRNQFKPFGKNLSSLIKYPGHFDIKPHTRDSLKRRSSIPSRNSRS